MNEKNIKTRTFMYIHTYIYQFNTLYAHFLFVITNIQTKDIRIYNNQSLSPTIIYFHQNDHFRIIISFYSN